MNLKVSEIFYSLQGEGARIGTPTIFIRLQGCKAKHACAKAGIKCDTEFESGKELNCNDNDITQLDNLPPELKGLYCDYNPLIYDFEPTLENIRNYISSNANIPCS